jgi:hypothetical protein
MKAFWAGVATTIVCGVFALFVLWFAVAASVGNPRVVECIKDNDKPAVAMGVGATRQYGYLRTFEVGACTAYFTANNSAKHFR